MKAVRFYQSIQMKLIIIYVLLILIAMQLIGVYFIRTMENSLRSSFYNDLNSNASLLAEYVKPYLVVQPETKPESPGTAESLNDVVYNFNKIIGAEIQVIDMNGVVLSSSMNLMDVGQKNTEPDVARALQGIRNKEREVIDSFNVRKSALALPVKVDNKTIGAVYILASMEELFGTIESINQIFIAGTMIALGLTAVLGVILSNTITTPIKAITKQATVMAEGNFNQTVKVVGQDEIGQLGKAFNYMTNRLKDALSSIEEEKEKLASILSNMSDGVVATDDMGHIMVMNRRAKQMLQLEESDAIGREVADFLGVEKPNIDEFVLGEDNTTILDFYHPQMEEPLKVRVTFTPIQRRGKGITGTIIVLQDVTEQEKLEASRREFVANVSHELRTPLTTIKSYLEALDDGALNERQLAEKFIGVARNETERMIRLVTDLLHLSRLDSKQATLHIEPTPMSLMLEDVADRFSFQLQQKSIEMRVSIEDEQGSELTALLDEDSIDQVLDNLVSNAIKYTPEGGQVEIGVRPADPEWIEVYVKDTGIGIPKKDLDRIFERFYRVDKARSRNMGGTGLGLSIAREIIRAHGGSIRIESDVQAGTYVAFTVPAAIGRGAEA